MKEVRKTRNVPSRETARAENGKRHRKRRKRSYTLYYILVLFFVLISGITLSVTVFFNIDTIIVSGNKLHNSEEIIANCGIEKGNNLFRINTEKAEKKLVAAFLDLDSVQIKRKFPNSLTIRVVDAVPTYYIQEEDGGYTALSAGGRVLKKGLPQTETTGGTVLKGLQITGNEMGSFVHQTDDDKYDALMKMTSVLKENGLSDITMINLENLVDMELEYQNRLRIRLGSMSELSYKIKFAKNIIETKLEKDEEGVIDATQPGKINYRPGFESTVTNSSDSTSSVSSEGAVSSGESSGHSSGESGFGSSNGSENR